MMMKRLFTLCLAMVMALSLAACGTSKTPTTSSTPADTSVEPTSTGHPAFHAGSNSKQNLTAKDGVKEDFMGRVKKAYPYTGLN